MAFITFLVLILGGIFCCYGLIVGQFKSVKSEFDMIVPYQFIVGILLLFFFLYDILTFGATINLLRASVLFGVLQIVATATKLVLGFVLSYGMITKYILTAPTDTKEKTDQIYKTFIGVQVTFGIVAIIIGIIGMIMIIF